MEEKKKLDTLAGGRAVLGADLAALGALGRVGRGIRSAKRGLGSGFGRAGRAAWDLAVLGAFGSAIGAVGWVGHGVWPCWARWARLGVGFGSGGRARRWAGLGWDLAFHVRSTLYTPSSCLYVVVFILMCISDVHHGDGASQTKLKNKVVVSVF